MIIYGDGDWGDFDGTFSYNAADASNATLIVQLTNTSPINNGGFITDFYFNNPLASITNVALDAVGTTDPDFSILGGPGYANAIIGSPYGQFDIGAGIGNGKPSQGIGVGVTESFKFILTGANLNNLSEGKFMKELSFESGAGEGCEPFIVRFQGFINDKSDKVPDDFHHTPEPVTTALFGLGILGFAFKRKRNKI